MGNTGYRDAVSLWREREKKERNKTRGNEVNRKEGRDCSFVKSWKRDAYFRRNYFVRFSGRERDLLA